uniref:Putative transcription factor n=1 Tax=Cladonia uncialis subsp. uncialis TaxID=180999 RepID=A0A1Z1C450_CLAUC|nr:putative transcription factor [Cladonia uncialis subsp. uncialis]AUW31218.1 putative transcription factor [Cladonia uncialis subsp. uncialis]
MEARLSSAVSTPENQQGGKTKLISCTLCQQRKVKCDKRQPTCTTCATHRASCIYVAPARSQRKRKKSSEEELLDRLNRYEALLNIHGISLDGLNPTSATVPNNSLPESSKTLILTEQVASPKENGSDAHSLKPSGKFITDSGKQSFVENGLWNGVSEELQGPVDMLRLYQTSGKDSHQLPTGAPLGNLLNAGDLALSSSATYSAADLVALHPNPLIIFRLWQIFLDNVNPLIKIVHAPTTQRRLLDASADLENISKEWEALMFAIYLAAIQSMSADECQIIMGESKDILFRRFHSAAKSALLRANFTSSLDILLVQAFTLYLLAVRQYHEPNSFWILTGTAVRLGQRIGLHRDGTLIGLSPFETEIRRRVWWRLMALDGQTAELCGAGLSVAAPRYDSKRPLNVNDSDLSPNMSALPSEHEGPTEMIFCGSRSEIGIFLRNTKTDSKWVDNGLDNIPVDKKDSQLDEIQALIERKYLRFCDPSVPLHLFTKLMADSTITALRLMARHPRKYPQGGLEMPPKERDNVFWISMHVLELYNLSMSTESIQRFLWNVNVQFQWHAFIIIANELQLRPEDDHTRDAWSKVEKLFEYNPDVIVNTDTPLHKAVSRLVLRAWSIRQRRLRRSKIQLPTPEFIAALQNLAAKKDTASQSKASHAAPEPAATEATSASRTSTKEPMFNVNGFSDSLTPTMLVDESPIDWSEWDNVLQNSDFGNGPF